MMVDFLLQIEEVPKPVKLISQLLWWLSTSNIYMSREECNGAPLVKKENMPNKFWSQDTCHKKCFQAIYTYIGHTFLNNSIFECPRTANYSTYRLQILHTYSGGSREEVCVIS